MPLAYFNPYPRVASLSLLAATPVTPSSYISTFCYREKIVTSPLSIFSHTTTLEMIRPHYDNPPPLPNSLPFFDNLPTDALRTIIYNLSTDPFLTPSRCPFYILSRVSQQARTLIASTIGTNIYFSVSGSADWLRFWLALSAPYLKKFSLNDHNMPSTEDICYMVSKWPQHRIAKLETYRIFAAVSDAAPPLVELDISEMRPLQGSAVEALKDLLLEVRTSLKTLKLDMRHFRVSTAVVNAKLHGLNNLAVNNLDAGCEAELFDMMRSLKPSTEVTCSLKELGLDVRDAIPALFRDKRREIEVLLQNLENFDLNYEDEFKSCAPFSNEDMGNLCAFMTLPWLRRICLSGAGIRVTREFVEDVLRCCEHLTDFRITDCDVDGSVHGDNPNVRNCNIVLSCIGSALTRYCPRWLTFQLGHIATLASCCPNLTHLRLFTARGAEKSLLQLGNAVRDSLVDLEVYPQRQSERDLVGAVISMVQVLEKLERLRIFRLELTTAQLKNVLAHCGRRLKVFVFSAPVFARGDDDSVGASIAEILVCAAAYNPNLRSLDCLFQEDEVPVIESREVADKLEDAANLLKSRAVRLRSTSLSIMVESMTAYLREYQKGTK